MGFNTTHMLILGLDLVSDKLIKFYEGCCSCKNLIPIRALSCLTIEPKCADKRGDGGCVQLVKSRVGSPADRYHDFRPRVALLEQGDRGLDGRWVGGEAEAGALKGHAPGVGGVCRGQTCSQSELDPASALYPTRPPWSSLAHLGT